MEKVQGLHLEVLGVMGLHGVSQGFIGFSRAS